MCEWRLHLQSRGERWGHLLGRHPLGAAPLSYKRRRWRPRLVTHSIQLLCALWLASSPLANSIAFPYALWLASSPPCLLSSFTSTVLRRSPAQDLLYHHH